MQAKARRGEPVDFIADFAYPLPASVIMDLLGVPRADLDRVKVWSDDIALFIGTAQVAGNKYLRAETGAKAMSDYFRGLVEARTAAADRRHDQPARAGARRPRRAVDRRDHRHLHPAAVRRPRDHDQPDRQRLPLFDEATASSGSGWSREPALAGSAIEEWLRYDGPSGAFARVAAADLEMGGQTIREGQRVFAFMNSANRDPEAFDDPERFDIGRAAEPAHDLRPRHPFLPRRAAGAAGIGDRRHAAGRAPAADPPARTAIRSGTIR